MEYCVQRKISRIFGIDIDINDKFFDTDKRYVLMEFMWNRSKEPDETIRAILFEMRCISYEDYILYRDEFVRLLNELHLHNESAYQIINAIKNEIVYSYPNIEYGDLSMIEHIDYASFLESQKLYGPVKIIVM